MLSEWWWPADLIAPDATWEHPFAGDGSDCLRCGEGVCHYLHVGVQRRCCTFCLYFSLLRPAVTSYRRPDADGFHGVPVWYCDRHVAHVPAEKFLVNAAMHAVAAGDDPAGELATELLSALHGVA